MQATQFAAPADYRPDIDGLRAVAVCAVLAFHAKLGPITGGFAGVDIFFVISGFLITSLLLKEWRKKGTISLSAFWARRVRRLAPALLVMIAALLAVAPFLLHRISGEVGGLARAALWTLGINANHFFLLEAGDYFGAATETNPLLHTWSLSVEEQFYVLWPLILLWCLKTGGVARAARVTVGGALLSFALSCYWGSASTEVGFYLMASRAWELLAGGLLAFLSVFKGMSLSGRAASTASWTGMACVLVALLLFSSVTPFPGPGAVLPVAGTVLLILGGSTAHPTFWSRALGSSPAQYLGKISYPLYLWHWPVLVLMRSSRLYRESVAADIAALAISGLLAVLTYEWVEKGTWKTMRSLTARRIVAYGVTGSVLLLGASAILGAWARYGWAYSPAEMALDQSRRDLPPLDCLFSALPTSDQIHQCYPNGALPTVLLWGDSHANQWRPAIETATASLGVRPATLTMRACRPLPGPVGSDPCVAFNRKIIDSLPAWSRERGLRGIVLSARWPEGTGTLATSIADRAEMRQGQYFDRRARSSAEALRYLEEETRSLLAVAKASNLRVLLVLPSPVQKFAAAHCLAVAPAECNVSRAELTPYMEPAETVIRRAAAGFDNVRLFEPKNFMCEGGTCPVVLNGLIAYTDDDHVSRTFAVSSSHQFRSALAWMAHREEDK